MAQPFKFPPPPCMRCRHERDRHLYPPVREDEFRVPSYGSFRCMVPGCECEAYAVVVLPTEIAAKPGDYPMVAAASGEFQNVKKRGTDDPAVQVAYNHILAGQGKQWPRIGDRVVVTTIANGEQLATVTRVVGLSFWAERPGRCWPLDTLHGPWRPYDEKKDAKLELEDPLDDPALLGFLAGSEAGEKLREAAGGGGGGGEGEIQFLPQHVIEGIERSEEYKAASEAERAGVMGFGMLPFPPAPRHVKISIDELARFTTLAGLVSDLMTKHFPDCEPDASSKKLSRRVAAALLELGYPPRRA